MKYCTQCGAPLSDDSAFCAQCGAAQPPLIDAGDPAALPPPYEPQRKKVKAWYFILPAVFILLAAAAALYFFVFNISPAEAFLNANKAFLRPVDLGAEFNELFGRMDKENFETSMTLTAQNAGLLDGQTQAAEAFKLGMEFIRAGEEGGLSFSADMGDAGVGELAAVLTGEKFIASLSGGGVDRAYYLDLPGDRNTPPIERLLKLFADMKTEESEKQAKINAVMKKALDIALKSVDMKWFSAKPGSYTDLFSPGKKTDAAAVSLTLDQKALVAFLDDFKENLDKDPSFFEELREVYADQTEDTETDVKKEFEKGLKDVRDAIEDSKFTFVWTAYQNWGKTEAIEISFEMPKEPRVFVALRLQNVQKDDTDTTKLVLDVVPGKEAPVKAEVLMEAKKKKGGSDFRLDLSAGDGKNNYAYSIEGSLETVKKNANEYDIHAGFDITTDMPLLTMSVEPLKSAIELDGQVFFGCSFENSRYFDVEELAAKAKKASNATEFMKKMFGMTVESLFPYGMETSAVKPAGTKAQIPSDPNVVAVVNGENILKSEADESYKQIIAMYAQFGLPVDETDKNMAADIKNEALNSLVEDKILSQKAKEMGFSELSAEDQDAVRNELNEYKRQVEELARAEAEEAAQTDASTDVEAETAERVARYWAESGYTEESLLARMQVNKAVDKLYLYITGKVTVDDTEIKNYYDENLKMQTDAIKADPGSFDSYNGIDPVLYIPEGTVRVQQILLKLPDEKSAEAEELYENGRKEEAMALLKPYFEKLKPKAGEVLKKVKKGTDFSRLMDTYSEDPGLEEEPAKSQGYLVAPGNSTYMPEFSAAALKLKEGQTSGLVKTVYGYHIIKNTGKLVPGAVPLADVYEAMKKGALEEKQQNEWEKQLEAWKNEAKIEYFKDRL